MSHVQKDTMRHLNLHRKNYCTVIEDSPEKMGMVIKGKDFLTWGPIDDATLALLKERREEKTRDNAGKEYAKPFFRLSPPRKGFGRKGMKAVFSKGGALGNRGEKMNDLIRRMI